ncbi:MAG: MarR family transcriptional regulator [Tardiphaga sp.]|jgi:DNA-binding MarR family transcriptional regulator|nr:MarR family transcriptional regulator [Tardiphaga sp.]
MMAGHECDMSKTRSADVIPKAAAAKSDDPVIDLERYVPALITFIANKLSRSATALYQRRFKVNVTEWRILVLLAIEPGIPASRICHVIGFDKGPVSRTLSVMQERDLVTIKTDPKDGRTHSISLAPKGREIHDRIMVIALDRERRLLACLREDEREVLIDLLGRVHGNLGAVTDHPENKE